MHSRPAVFQESKKYLLQHGLNSALFGLNLNLGFLFIFGIILKQSFCFMAFAEYFYSSLTFQ